MTPRKRITEDLIRHGWKRDDAPFEEVGECTDVVGCSRAGRWTHPHVQGEYCAQHASQGLAYQKEIRP